jgi:hypothetical protein
MKHGTLFVALTLALTTIAARARNVDLSTVPRRDAVQLTIYNGEDLTLVRETRAVTFRKGANPLQFSWANTLIDPTSVELKFLTHGDQLDVLDTTFPHDKPQMLYWNVGSQFDGEATVEITYFTSGITWTADYVAVADRAESQLALEGFVRVFNRSGEPYEDARVRLVVGTINLVEKIATLARVDVGDVRKLKEETRERFKRDAMKELGDAAAKDGENKSLFFDREKQIVKEGLSEYFIYTVEGTETIPNGWSKRMRSLEAAAVPFRVQYRYRPAEYGEQLVRMYLLNNDKPSKLGTTPLPDGQFRLFRDNGRGGLSFLAGQPIKYVPVGDKVELNLGADPNVVFELVKRRAARDDIWLRVDGTDVYKQARGPGVQIEVNSSVVGWDDHEVYAQRVRNYTAKPIEVEVRRTFPGHVHFRSALNATLYDFRTPQFTATVAAGKRSDLLFEVVRHQGRNAKQDNVTIEPADVNP